MKDCPPTPRRPWRLDQPPQMRSRTHRPADAHIHWLRTSQQDADPKHALLRKRLLRLGGFEVSFPLLDTNVEVLLSPRTLVWSGEGARRIEGEVNQCHANSARAYVKVFWP
jgi:hypothetical protein